jgi:ABC-type branched-subunit amino acid transport system substrate-binding protein
MSKLKISFIIWTALLIILPSQQTVAESNKLKVGITLPLSGAASTYGVALNQGLQLFLEEHPSEAGNLDFVIDDSQYDGKKVVSSLRKMLSIDKVDLSFVWGVLPADVAAPIAQQMKAPLIAMTTEAVAKDRSYVAAIQIPLEGLNVALLKFIVEKNIKSIGIISANFGAAQRWLEILRPTLPNLVFDEVVADGSTDLQSIVSRIKRKPVEAVLLLMAPEQILALSRAAATQHFRALAIGGDNFGDDNLRAEVARAFGKAAYVYGVVDPQFKERYFARFKNASNIFEAASGYSMGQIFSALTKDERRGQAMISGLVGQKFHTAIGLLEFVASDNGIKLELIPEVYE